MKNLIKLVSLTIIILLVDTSDDSFSYWLFDSTKPSKFDDSPFESLGTCQKVEALHLLLMVMSGSHVLGEILELSQIRLSSQDSLFNTISQNESSFLKNSDFSDVSLRESFHISSAFVHYSLYSIFFTESSTPTIFLNPSGSNLAGAVRDQVKFGAIFHWKRKIIRVFPTFLLVGNPMYVREAITWLIFFLRLIHLSRIHVGN